MWDKKCQRGRLGGNCSTSSSLTEQHLPLSSINQFLGLLPREDVTTKMAIRAGLLVDGVTQIKLPETNLLINKALPLHLWLENG
jgi:hypothetical protein